MCDLLEGRKGFIHKDPSCVIAAKGDKDSSVRIHQMWSTFLAVNVFSLLIFLQINQ